MVQSEDASPALSLLIAENAVGLLRERAGRMAVLGSEDGALKLDWVEGIERLLADATALEEVEAQAREMWRRGIRHVIWAGMGGSVMAVRVLTELGFCSSSSPYFPPEPKASYVAARAGRVEASQTSQKENTITIYPLDSTDPASLNQIVRKLAQVKKLSFPQAEAPADQAFLRTLLSDVLMVGVSMGMTSEEPITHLTWYSELLEQAQLSAAEHLLVMTLPGSYLDSFAHEHHVPSLPLQLDGGTGTGGRMSAPTTRVFLLPVALYLTSQAYEGGQLREVLQQSWQAYNLELATQHPAEHPFVRLAAALSDASLDGACRLLLELPEDWRPLLQWVEQLMEESLGKGGKGVVVFNEQPLNMQAPGYHGDGLLYVYCTTDPSPSNENQPTKAVYGRGALSSPSPHPGFTLYQPYLASKEPLDRLVSVAASFLGWQLSMALYGYLQDITFAGQPAVENYKARVRKLRALENPLQVSLSENETLAEGIFTLFAPQTSIDERERAQASSAPTTPAYSPGLTQTVNSASRIAVVLARDLQKLVSLPNAYLDLTINGEADTGHKAPTQPHNRHLSLQLGRSGGTQGKETASLLDIVERRLHEIGNELLGVPVKLRRAPAAYHSTEQSEMDGPPSLISLRLLARNTETSLLGTYTDTFLRAQAISTWQAMIEQGRTCFLLVLDCFLDEAGEPLDRLFDEVAALIRSALPPI